MKSFRHLSAMCSLAIALTLAPVHAFAQEEAPVELIGDVKVEKTVVEDGKEKKILVPAETVLPGDKLVFTTAYSNKGAKSVTDFIVTNPIPEAIKLGAEDASKLEVSVDDGKAWGKLATLTVPDEKGEPRPATIDDVTHVRWTLTKLDPGAKGSVSYSGVVR